MSVNWDDPAWGGNVHIGQTVADDHDASEQRAENGRG